MTQVLKVFQTKGLTSTEDCFCVEIENPLTEQEKEKLLWLLRETYQPGHTGFNSFLCGATVTVGPRLAVETAYSSNAVAICKSIGLEKVLRLEKFRRYTTDTVQVTKLYDKMTECVYDEIPDSFAVESQPEEVYVVRLIEDGIPALRAINAQLGLGMDETDIEFYHKLFTEDFKRNPTNVECFQLGQANSEHCRHWFFKGIISIDGVDQKASLMELVQRPLQMRTQSNSTISFSDNSSAIKGRSVVMLSPVSPGRVSGFQRSIRSLHSIFTAETHNHPTMIQPFHGAETGTGGRIRDVQATGKGGLVVAGTVGYCVGNLLIPGYEIPGEDPSDAYPERYASPLDILINASNGASDYGNKFGEPVVNGFARTLGIKFSDSRREWIKPVLFTGGIGSMYGGHAKKEDPEFGMTIIQIGGPAYRIGLGGGAASSMSQGQNIQKLDFDSVQRGNAQMEQKVNRVIRACIELGSANPIASIHDQGAGGPCNVLTEIINPAGGKIRIRAINVGDASMSVLEIWGAEYQERLALLVRPENLPGFQTICRRENVPCEVLGLVTNDGLVTLYDAQDSSTPVNLALDKILGSMPRKRFAFERPTLNLQAFTAPDLSIAELVERIFKLPSVGSKGFLVRKVDRSVTGLVAQQQCCGPLHLPVGDVAVVADSHYGLSGAATANGEQPLKLLMNPEAGARMCVAEMLTNIVWVASDGLPSIKTSGNWMWPAKLAGEGALLYATAKALSDFLIELGGAEIDGGKDSLSMSARVGDAVVKSPPQLVISGYVTVPDITKKVTPNLKGGGSIVALIDLSRGHMRLGGSALFQSFGEIGDECPDADALLLKNSFAAVQQLISQGLISAGHDRSDGGLITTLIEMALSGNTGLHLYLDAENLVPMLFNEEVGLVIEYEVKDRCAVSTLLAAHCIEDCLVELGNTDDDLDAVLITVGTDEQTVFEETLVTLRAQWEATSDKLEELQMDPDCARAATNRAEARQIETYTHMSFMPEKTQEDLLSLEVKPKVAIIREVGSNGDREMTAAFEMAGFDPVDIVMEDIVSGAVTSLDDFKGATFVGGFSNADVMGSGKGWSAVIRYNQNAKKVLGEFYAREDTFSFGSCNGCQLMALLGWVPGLRIVETSQPRFVHNDSGRFESNWLHVRIAESPAIMLKGMEGSVLGIWVAHGEGKLLVPHIDDMDIILGESLAPVRFVDEEGIDTEEYPCNPNGSPQGITALCSPDGRHLAMMPHPERSFLTWQMPWMPESWKVLEVSPWFRMFQNARAWCDSVDVRQKARVSTKAAE